jgi:CheY-like chemotaxis protein
MGQPARIVVVDDDADLRMLAHTLLDTELASVDHDILEAASGIEALVQCTREHIDVMVLDMHMPEVDGIAVLEHLSALKNRPCVVAWSADLFALRRASLLGADMTVHKGDDALALVEAVHHCLEGLAPAG